MKNFLKICLALFLVLGIAVTAYSDNGTSVGNRTFTLLNSVSTATGATSTSTAATWDNPMNSITCDVLLSNATATGTLTIEGNIGTSTTSFQAGNLLNNQAITANTLNTFSITGKPTRIIRAKYTATATQTNVTVNCGGVQ